MGITNEEAWNRIDSIIAKHEIDDENVTIINEKDYDALRMARKILESQPCEDWYDVPSDEMTLEQARQAVKDLRKKLAEEHTKYNIYGGFESCDECANEHRQLAEWLKELKKYRSIFEKVGKILADNGYTIDDLDTIYGKINREVNADEDSD